MSYNIRVEVRPKRGGVPENIIFKNVEGINPDEAIKNIKSTALDIAEDLKDFWECRVVVKYFIV